MNSPSRLAAALGFTLSIAFPWATPAQKSEPTAPRPVAPAEEKPYEPNVGQPGKDVVWLPTSQALVDRMLDMAKATPKDYMMDLGSGDGRMVITAARRGITALGVEYDPKLVALSRRNALQAGVAERATFVEADLFTTDLRRATVITLFLLPEINLKLRPRILELEPGTRIVSNTFGMGEWEADETAVLDSRSDCETYCIARLWIVPAQVAGRHKTAQGDLTLEQTFQKVKGTLRRKGKAVPVEGRVVGQDVTLVAGGRKIRATMKAGQLALR